MNNPQPTTNNQNPKTPKPQNPKTPKPHFVEDNVHLKIRKLLPTATLRRRSQHRHNHQTRTDHHLHSTNPNNLLHLRNALLSHLHLFIHSQLHREIRRNQVFHYWGGGLRSDEFCVLPQFALMVDMHAANNILPHPHQNHCSLRHNYSVHTLPREINMAHPRLAYRNGSNRMLDRPDLHFVLLKEKRVYHGVPQADPGAGESSHTR